MRVFLAYCPSRGLLISMVAAMIGVFCGPADGFGDDRTVVGYVCDSKGDWLQDGVKLSREKGCPVFAGATLTLDPAYKKTNPVKPSIIVHLYNGQRVDRLPQRTDDFDRPIVIPRLIKTTSAQRRFFSAIGELFSKNPEQFVPANARGSEPRLFTDAVLLLDGDKLDLRPILRNVTPGNYRVRFLSQQDAVAPSDAAPPGMPTVHWNPASPPAPLAVRGLKPGLWCVSLLDPESESAYDGDAWVLVCKASEYARVAEAFETTRAWSDPRHPDSGRGGRRAALEILSREK